MRFKIKSPPRMIVFILVDFFMFLFVIATFAWITYRPIIDDAHSVAQVPTMIPILETATPSPETLTPTPSITLTMTPMPAVGDFSDAFAQVQLDDELKNVYRSDDYIISVKQCSVEDAVAYVADVYVRDIHDLKTAFVHNSFKGIYLKTEDFLELCSENNAFLAVSGDFVSIREDGTVIRNGEVLQLHKYNDICVLYIDGSMAVYGLREITRDQLTDGTVWQTWCFGPNLLDQNGNAIEVDHPLMRINPRCAIGYYAPGHYCFVIVDGRQANYSDGMTLTELSTFMAGLGCKTAYNLDGGQTAQMALDDNFVNMPANGGRRVGDIIYIERADDKQ